MVKTLVIVAGLLVSAGALAQHGGGDRDNDRRSDRWEYDTYPAVPPSYTPRVGDPDPYAPKVGVPNPYAPKVGAPDPYAPKVGAPNPYAPKVGAPDPYATQAGVPDPYATRVGDPNAGRIQPDTGGGARRR